MNFLSDLKARMEKHFEEIFSSFPIPEFVSMVIFCFYIYSHELSSWQLQPRTKKMVHSASCNSSLLINYKKQGELIRENILFRWFL